jgi:hypothetical protein
MVGGWKGEGFMRCEKQILSLNKNPYVQLYTSNVLYNDTFVHNYIDYSSDGASENIVCGLM